MAILEGDAPLAGRVGEISGPSEPGSNSVADDPWTGLMEGEEDDQDV